MTPHYLEHKLHLLQRTQTVTGDLVSGRLPGLICHDPLIIGEASTTLTAHLPSAHHNAPHKFSLHLPPYSLHAWLIPTHSVKSSLNDYLDSSRQAWEFLLFVYSSRFSTWHTFPLAFKCMVLYYNAVSFRAESLPFNLCVPRVWNMNGWIKGFFFLATVTGSAWAFPSSCWGDRPLQDYSTFSVSLGSFVFNSHLDSTYISC